MCTDHAPVLTRAPSPPAPDLTGPRYTSYPTADRFTPAFGPVDHALALARRRPGPLSVYVHVPFCESVCYYCACNKVVTKHKDRAAPYLATLMREIDLYEAALGGPQPASQLHLGGGTPTFLSDDELARLMQHLQRTFPLTPDAEVAIEVDPRTVDEGRLGHLRQLGFNRLSFGVQDFDPDVQQAVHRVQSHDEVRRLVLAARDLGFTSTNVDLICGLPRQTERSFARTLEQVVTLRPERIALYAYAHLPERFKPQRRIDASDLPDADARLRLLALATEAFTAAGYLAIGMDHFALADDALAVAKREGRLHRNFQGYATRPDSDLVGLGVSAIGRMADTYGQNHKTVEAYTAAVDAGEWPIERGIRLDAEDEARRDAIMALMCQGELEHAGFEAVHGGRFAERFALELAALAPLAKAGYVVLGADAVRVTAEGWPVVRAIARVFDPHRGRPRGDVADPPRGAAASADQGCQPVVFSRRNT